MPDDVGAADMSYAQRIIPTATERELAYEREVLAIRRRSALAALLAAGAAMLVALVLLLCLLWLILSTPKATAFDADGTRCWTRAVNMTCIQTAPQRP